MYRRGFMLCCLFLIISCMSNMPKQTIASSQQEKQRLTDQAQTMVPTQAADEQSGTAQPTVQEDNTAQLLSELKRTVERYDVQKVFNIFGTIVNKYNEKKDCTVLTDARNAIQPLLQAITLEAGSFPKPVKAGTPFTEGFTARVIVNTPEKQLPLANYPITVMYPSLGTGSTLKTEFVHTDSEGLISFIPPVPKKACDGKLSFYLSVTGKDGTCLHTTKNLSISFPYKVASIDKQIPSIIAILDYDENNKPIFSGNLTATRLLMGLMKRRFNRIGLDEYRELTLADEAVVIAAAQAKFGSAIDRFIFGKTYIAIKVKEDRTFTCTIRARISVWDFKQNKKIHELSFTHTANAATKSQAITRARTEFGETIIAERLNYTL